MASTDISAPASRLSLSLDTLPSSSPFPSPSSSFLPPPMPHAHEYALKPLVPSSSSNGRFVKRGANAKKELEDVDTPGDINSSSSLNGETHFNSAAPNGGPADGAPFQKSPFSTHVTSSAPDAPSVPSPTTPTEGRRKSPVTPTQETIFLSIAESSSPSISHTQNLPLTDASLQSISSQSNELAGHEGSQSQQTANHRISTSSAASSIMSSRPAPPSPAVSRHTSGVPSPAVSRRVSKTPSSYSSHSRSSSQSRSRPISGVRCGSRPASGTATADFQPSSTSSISRRSSTRKSKGPGEFTPSIMMIPPESSLHEAQDGNGTSIVSVLPSPSYVNGKDAKQDTSTEQFTFITIRDFAFPETDPRFAGLGSDVPRANRPRVLTRRLGAHRRLSSSSISSSSAGSQGNNMDEEADEESRGSNGWSGYRWGLGRLSWTGHSATSDAGNFPSHTDFERNFGDAEDPGDDSSNSSLDGYEMDDNESYEDASEEEPPLLPGLYRALYAFEPEGTAEMRLEEDQVVQVIGRGGGVGWAVVLKDSTYSPDENKEGLDTGELLGDGKGHALVPESYLELIKLDQDNS